MYAQYQQYQNQNNQYQQQSVTNSSSQGAAQWNGTSWVYSNNNNSQQQPQQKQQIIPPNPVETFTQYYHGWTKREEQLRNQLKTINPNHNERQNVESNRQWAKYYAEESSRAAHHFHQNPGATSAPFDLPPTPPTAGSIQNNTANSVNNNAHKRSYATAVSGTTKKNNNNSSSPSSNPSGSITRYVKRNIERPEVKSDPKLKAYVQSEIEKEIAAVIQQGALQSKNWDLVPLIALPNATQAPKPVPPPPPPPPQHAQYHHQQQHQTYGGSYQQKQQSFGGTSAYQNNNSGNYGNSSSGNYYGPVSSHSVPSTTSNSHGGNQSQNSGSYYGPDSSHNHAHNFQQPFGSNQNNNNSFSSSSQYLGKKKHQFQPQQQEAEDFIPIGHYGPSSNQSNKKSKKNHRKHNKLVVMNDDDISGMDHSQQTMSKRASRFSGRGGIHEATIANSRSSVNGHDKYMGKGTIGGNKTTLDETDFEQMTVKGACTTLEKDYLRLTAPPRAELVRPFAILQQHLWDLQSEYYGCNRDGGNLLQDRMTMPQTKWGISDPGDAGNSQFHRRQHDYLWFCSQLKAIRQDCTVQRIQCELAVDVYETHARIALQEGDLNEYNQCQTQLKGLYENRPSSVGKSNVVLYDHANNSSIWKHEKEFVAYRLLYYVFLSTNEKYSGGSSDMFHIMLSLSSEDRKYPAIQHALKVREAVASSDYFSFFSLHNNCPNLGVFLTDLLIPTMRMRGLRRIAKAYRPSIELRVCLKYLGFGADDATSEEAKDSSKIDDEGKSWLISCGGIVEGSRFVTKDSQIHAPATPEDKKNSLI
eukprot:CAMPEP_0116126990 /NCGR_PEP_ID=MMETSP0329-20121206/6612_1 /TAXON_ID=697910 /ORGANISM="Pseudo-nitzschia arenysensis, Strain B593" /LENGTH=809 /DNA_ID=CAMNT_0003621081 /DNA_START=121 /DNA_END=2550 /DNA_ORIENTATION=-